MRAACVSELLRISAHQLGKHIGDYSRAATIDWGWPSGAWVRMRSDTGMGITFHYDYQRKPVELYRAQLVTTAQHLGGVRYWWLCPRCRRRVAHLYGGPMFWCRHCHGLTYATVQERRDMIGTMDVRLLQLFRRLKGDGNFLTVPRKPAWMRWRTYYRLADEYNELLKLRELAWMVDLVGALRGTYAETLPVVDLDAAAQDVEQQYREIRRRYRTCKTG